MGIEDVRNDLATRIMEARDRGAVDPIKLKDEILREFAPRQP